MSEKIARLYGVSYGNGNDGVSHMFPAFYVRTDDPFRLAELATLSKFKEGNGQRWAKENVEIDGEAGYTISAMLLDPPCEETDNGEYPSLWVCDTCEERATNVVTDECPCGGTFGEIPFEDCEDGRNWSDHNGAWFICEVFPEDEPRDGTPRYASLAEAFSAEDIALHARLSNR